MLSRCFLDFSVGVRASVIRLSQISSFSFNRSFGCVFVLSCCFLDFSVGVRDLVIELSKISSFFS